MTNANIIQKFISALLDRCGFDHWWDQIDAKDQKDIKAELLEILDKYAPNHTDANGKRLGAAINKFR